jgi:hypothetical protein
VVLCGVIIRHRKTCLFVFRPLKSILVDLSLPKRKALFDFLRDSQFVEDREETMDQKIWVGSRKMGLYTHGLFFPKWPSWAGGLSIPTIVRYCEIITRNNQSKRVQLPFFEFETNLNYALKLNQTNNPIKMKQLTLRRYLQNSIVLDFDKRKKCICNHFSTLGIIISFNKTSNIQPPPLIISIIIGP